MALLRRRGATAALRHSPVLPSRTCRCCKKAVHARPSYPASTENLFGKATEAPREHDLNAGGAWSILSLLRMGDRRIINAEEFEAITLSRAAPASFLQKTGLSAELCRAKMRPDAKEGPASAT